MKILTNIALTVSLSVVGALLLIGIAVLLHFTLFAYIRMKKQVRELNRRFEYLHALLFGQDAQYIKRIENIAITNLTYVNTHQTFNKRFKDIRDKFDSNAQVEMNRLKDLVSDHDYKTLKNELAPAKASIDAFETEVNGLNNDLQLVIRPEEECRQASLAMKEKLRKIKQDFYVRQADLSLVLPSFERAFEIFDETFKTFENYLESAQYEEAKALLPRTGSVIDALGKALKEMPNICITIQSVIPDKLSSLEDRYEELLKAGYPLNHLVTKTHLQAMHRDLEALTEQVRAFNLQGVQQRLDGILARIDDFVSAFEREKEARVIFEGEIDRVYREDSKVENNYIRLSNALPELNAIYYIPPEEKTKIDQINALINRSGATKRSLDTLVHASAHQPYTLLVEKMHSLADESRQTNQAIDDFNRYLLSLKDDAEEASRCLYVYEGKLRDTEERLRIIDLPQITEKYAQRITELYGVIDEIYSKLVKPINLVAINELVHRLKGDGDFLERQVAVEMEKMYLASASTLYANRDRMNHTEIRVACRQAEGLYAAGEFNQAYEVTRNAIQAFRQAE